LRLIPLADEPYFPDGAASESAGAAQIAAAESAALNQYGSGARCDRWCAVLDAVPKADGQQKSPPCQTCDRKEISEGILVCAGCGRWFAVREGIPDLVRDGLRLIDEEVAFLERRAERIPPEILEKGKPFGARGEGRERAERLAKERTPEEGRILDEGRYWGDFMEVFWDLGDRAIFDVRARGSHPTFLGQGVREPDERDRSRRVGFYPEHLARILFDWMDAEAGGRVLDVGCGGGQYGLEAARRGLDAVGFDPGRRALELGRIHARETGADVHYVRAVPEQPPFLPDSFDALMAKDSLHHLAGLHEALNRLDALLRPGGIVAVHEHVGKSPRKARMVGWLMRRLVPRIQRRWGCAPAPPALLVESPNEDAGMAEVEGELRARYRTVRARRELFFYHDAEAAVYYALGKREWPARIVRWAAAALERALLWMGEPAEHLAFVGRKPDGLAEEINGTNGTNEPDGTNCFPKPKEPWQAPISPQASPSQPSKNSPGTSAIPEPSTESHRSHSSHESHSSPDSVFEQATSLQVPGWPRWKCWVDGVLGGALPMPHWNAAWTRQEKGRWGEYAAARALWKAGFRLLGRNLRFSGGEIDVLADDKGTLVFAEVKTRLDESRNPPFLGVDDGKLRRIRSAALEYLSRVAMPRPPARVDVVAVVPDPKTGRPMTRHKRAVAWITEKNPEA